jgi:methylmalonyl-CoA/ethylmalonyl-CoA epimerase
MIAEGAGKAAATSALNDFGLRFHHLGLAARRPNDAAILLRGLGYRIGEPIFDPEQNVNLTMCSRGAMPDIEVICPGQGKGPVDGLVARHSSGIVYHLCYVTDDLADTLQKINDARLRWQCVSPPKPAILFGGRRVSFYMIVGIGLIEIIEEAAGSGTAW